VATQQAEQAAEAELALAALAQATPADFSTAASVAAPSSGVSNWTRFSPASLSLPARSNLVSSASSASRSLGSADSVHVSLSRTVVLRREQIDTFIDALTQETKQMRHRPPLPLILRGSKLYFNDERTRCFAALLVHPFGTTDSLAAPPPQPPPRSCNCPPVDWSAAVASHVFLLQLIARIDALLLTFDQPAYYDPPELHATVAWKLPTLPPTSPARPPSPSSSHAAASATTSVPPSRPSITPDSRACACLVDRVHVTIGNRLYTLPITDENE
jgi:hypothetical protein